MKSWIAFALCLCACGVDNVPPGPRPDPGGIGNNSGLPCDVVTALSSCQSCHGRPLAGGAPVPLVTYADLTRASSTGETIADRAVARMTAATLPMPPSPAAPANPDDVATLESWIAAGMPPGDCMISDPFGQPAQCSSGRTWTMGDEGSPSMQPGAACIACHNTDFEAPRLPIAGTVYPTGHEPDQCYGAPGGATVVITGANNRVFNLPVNGAGNFYMEPTSELVFPITAKVVANGMERAMVAPQTTGDCNSCHTQNGTMLAPGRIVMP